MEQSQPTGGLSLAEIAAKVRLTTEQVARLCGVSRRQLSYWVQRGIVLAGDGFPVDAVEKVLLIKRELDRGRSLKQATQSVDDYLAQREACRRALAEMPPEALAESFAEHLGRLGILAEELRQAVVVQRSALPLRRLSRHLDQLRLEEWLARPTGAVPLCAQVRRLEEALARMGASLSQMREECNGAGDPSPTECLIDEEEVLSRLALSATEAARVCGVTVRQLTYWTDKGIVGTAAGESRSYGLGSLRKALLIRQAMETGQALAKAVAAVDARLAQKARDRAEADARPAEALREALERRLEGLGRQIEALRERLALHLGLSRLRGAMAALDGSDVEARLRALPPDDPQAAQFVRLVELAADHLQLAVSQGLRASS